jgi:hypothetical protein
MAPVVLQAISAMLNALPIAYVIRIDTTDSKVYQISGSGMGSSPPIGARPDERLNPWRFSGSEVRE